MEWIILIILIVFIFIITILKSKNKNQNNFYTVSENFLSPAERSFFGCLMNIIGNKYYIFPKVRVADVLKVKKDIDKRNWQSAFNRISKKHFDFIVCDKNTINIYCAIELDDSTHKKGINKERDAFKEKICYESELKLVRFNVKKSYSSEEIKENFKKNNINLDNIN